MEENTFYSICTYNMLIVFQQYMLVVCEKRRKTVEYPALKSFKAWKGR